MLALLALLSPPQADACDPAPALDAQVYPAWGQTEVPTNSRVRVHLGADRLDPEQSPSLLVQDAFGVPLAGEVQVAFGTLDHQAQAYLSFIPDQVLPAGEEIEVIVLGERLDDEVTEPTRSVFMTAEGRGAIPSGEAAAPVSEVGLAGFYQVEEDLCWGAHNIAELTPWAMHPAGSALHFYAASEDRLPDTELMGSFLADPDDPYALVSVALPADQHCLAVVAEARDGTLGEPQVLCQGDEQVFDDWVCGTGMFWGCASTPGSGAPLGLVAVLAGLVGLSRRRRD